jgi:hypothetical protein
MIEGRFVWRTYEEGSSDGGSFYDEDGAVIAAPVRSPLEAPHNFYRENLTDVVWWIPDDRQTELIGYVSEVAPDGALVRSVRYEGNDMWPIAWIDDDRVVVLRFYPRDRSIGAAYIVNLETGEMNEIDGLRPTDQDRDSYVTTLMTGEFAMVDAPGSCLHVRAEANVAAKSLECFADGVLFEVTGEAALDSGGAEWLPVRAPGAIEGFASSEFLLR